MGITKQYLRYVPNGTCNVVASTNGTVSAVNDTVCAVTACESVHFYNLKSSDKVNEFSESEKSVTTLGFSSNRRHLAVGYADGVIRLFDRKAEDRSALVTFAGHRTGVNCVAFSRDGLTLASGGKDSVVIVWDVVNECGMFRLNGHKGSVTHLQFSLDGRFLISSSKDTFVKFWSIDSQSCFYTLTDSRSEVYSFALVKEDTLLLVGSSEVEIRVFELDWFADDKGEQRDEESAKKKSKNGFSEEIDLESQANGIVRCKKRGLLLRQAKGRALQMAVSDDEKIVACVGSSDMVDIFRVYSDDESRKRIRKKLRKAKKRNEESEETPSVSEADIANDVTILVSRVGDFRGSSKVRCVDFAPSVRFTEENLCEYRFFALMGINSVHLVNVAMNLKSNEVTCEDFANLDQLGHRSDVRCLAMAESDFGFVSGCAENAFIWNRHSLKVCNVLEDEHMKDVTAALFVPGDKHVITACKDGSVFLFELATNEMLENAKKAHAAAIWQLVAAPDKKGFLSCGADKKVLFWSYELVSDGPKKRVSMKVSRSLELPDECLCVAISPNSKFVAVGLLDNTARIFFVDTLKFFVSLYGHSLPVTAIDISYDSKLIITGSADKSVKIWGLDFGDCHKSLHAHDDVVSSVQFVPKEHLFWSGGKDGVLKQWDADKFERVQVLALHSAEIRAITQTNNGKFLVSASHDRSIRMWELTDEIIVLQEEEENEREKEYERRLTEREDVLPGEEASPEAHLAPTTNVVTIKSAEDIIDAVEIVRNENIQRINDPKHTTHPLVAYLKSASLDRFILDIIQRVPSSHLEKSLLMVPLSFVSDILKSLGVCVSECYKPELASRVLIFLIKIHHGYITGSRDMLEVMDGLRKVVPRELRQLRNTCGFNLAALRLLQKEIEERSQVKMFADFSDSKSKKKIRKAVMKTFA